MRILPVAFGYNIQKMPARLQNNNLSLRESANIDTVSFSGNKKKEARKTYEKLVTSVSDDTLYSESPIGVKDIGFLLKKKKKDFKDIITKPVECKTSSGRKCESTVFFYTDAPATEKLLNKLDDKKATLDILKVQKGWRGTTALHAAVYSEDVAKVDTICTSVSKKGVRELMRLHDMDDDPLEAAIPVSSKIYNILRSYLSIALRK